MLKEEQFGEEVFLHVTDEYNKEELHKLFGTLYDLLDKAEQAGYINTHVVFNSTMDAYDPYPGPVEVTIRGERKLTPYEEKEQAEYQRIETLSKKFGITYYEAGVVDRLEKAKKVRL